MESTRETWENRVRVRHLLRRSVEAMCHTARNGSRRMTSKQTNDASAKTSGVLSRAEPGRRSGLSAVLRIRHLMNTAADGTALSIVSGGREGQVSGGFCENLGSANLPQKCTQKINYGNSIWTPIWTWLIPHFRVHF